jgi:hypothetical protein
LAGGAKAANAARYTTTPNNPRNAHRTSEPATRRATPETREATLSHPSPVGDRRARPRAQRCGSAQPVPASRAHVHHSGTLSGRATRFIPQASTQPHPHRIGETPP